MHGAEPHRPRRSSSGLFNLKVTTLNKPDKQDPDGPSKRLQTDSDRIGSGEPYHKIAQNPMAREMNGFFAPRLAEVGQFGLRPSKDGITFAGIVPAIVLESRSSRMCLRSSTPKVDGGTLSQPEGRLGDHVQTATLNAPVTVAVLNGSLASN